MHWSDYVLSMSGITECYDGTEIYDVNECERAAQSYPGVSTGHFGGLTNIDTWSGLPGCQIDEEGRHFQFNRNFTIGNSEDFTLVCKRDGISHHFVICAQMQNLKECFHCIFSGFYSKINF